MELYQAEDGRSEISKQIEAQKQRRELAQKKKSKLLGFNAMGELSDADFLAMNKACSEEIADAEAQIQELEQQLFSRDEFRKHMESVRTALERARRDVANGMITPEFVSQYIDKIFVTPENDGVLRLDIKIFIQYIFYQFPQIRQAAILLLLGFQMLIFRWCNMLAQITHSSALRPVCFCLFIHDTTGWKICQ